MCQQKVNPRLPPAAPARPNPGRRLPAYPAYPSPPTGRQGEIINEPLERPERPVESPAVSVSNYRPLGPLRLASDLDGVGWGGARRGGAVSLRGRGRRLRDGTSLRGLRRPQPLCLPEYFA